MIIILCRWGKRQMDRQTSTNSRTSQQRSKSIIKNLTSIASTFYFICIWNTINHVTLGTWYKHQSFLSSSFYSRPQQAGRTQTMIRGMLSCCRSDDTIVTSTDLSHLEPFSKQGISLSYLLNEFVEECGGNEALKRLTTTDVCNTFVKPATETCQSSYCDMLLEQQQK